MAMADIDSGINGDACVVEETPRGHFLVKGYWGCAAGRGRIFTTGLTIMGLHFE